jgi:hypothetical protein
MRYGLKFYFANIHKDRIYLQANHFLAEEHFVLKGFEEFKCVVLMEHFFDIFPKFRIFAEK